jgi:gliding motility-associated-like protein
MQKKIANFYPFPIRLGRWGKVFLILVWILLYQEVDSQSISHAYKNQLDTSQKLYYGANFNLLLNSKKNKTNNELMNFYSPFHNSRPKIVNYTIQSNFSLSTKTTSLKFTQFRPMFYLPEDSSFFANYANDNLIAVDKNGNYYQFKYLYYTNDKFKRDYTVVKYNAQLEKLWSRKFSINGIVGLSSYSSPETSFTCLNKEDAIQEFNDGSFIHVNHNANTNQKLIYKISANGTLVKTRKIKNLKLTTPPYTEFRPTIDVLVRDNYCYILYNNYLIKLDSQLNLLNSVLLPIQYKIGQNYNYDIFFDRKSNYNSDKLGIVKISNQGAPSAGYLPDSINFLDTFYIIDTSLQNINRFRHNYLGEENYNDWGYGIVNWQYADKINSPEFDYYFHTRAIQMTNDSTWDIVCYNKAIDDQVLGIRHIQFDPRKREVRKNNFTPIPKLYPRGSFVDSFNRHIRLTGRDFFNINFVDHNEFVVNQVSDSMHWYDKYAIIHVKNFDFSPLNTYPTTCDRGFFLDTLALSYSYPAGTLTDTTLSLIAVNDSSIFRDSIIPSYNLPAQTYYGDLGLLNAKFKLDKDSSCAAALALRSDSSLKSGESLWIVRYLDYSHTDSLRGINYLDYMAVYGGRIQVTHIHSLNFCTDIYIDTTYKKGVRKNYAKMDSFLCSPISHTVTLPLYKSFKYLWYHDLDTMRFSTLTDTGLYKFSIWNSCGGLTDSFRIRSQIVGGFSTSNMVVCKQKLPVVLHSPHKSPLASYRWNISTTDTLDSLKVSSYGWQRIVITTPCSSLTDSIYIDSPLIVIPSHPDSISLCATTYKITRPQNLRLEEKFVNSWLNRDSLILTKNQKLVFRWTDSCGTVTYDSIYDYQRGSFPSLPKSQKLCETFASLITNTQTTITQFEFVNSWQPNNTVNLQLGPNYIRRDDNCGNTQFDTILGFSTKQPKNIITEDSLVLCPQEFPYTLTVSDTFKTYLWSNGDNLHYSKLKIKNSKFYTTVTDDCYMYTDSIEVKEITTPNEIALEDIYRELCKALEKTRVETKLTYPQYIWNQAASNKFFYRADTSQNLVTLYIPRRCDTLKDSIALYWLDPRLTPPLYTVDSSYCKQAEGAVKLTLTNRNDYLSYLWKGDSLPYIFVNTLGTTKFFAKNLCYEKYFDIPPYSCPLDPIGLPSAFSPNGDKLNDSWGLQGAKNIILHSLSIYNRWGEKVFETTNPNHVWDGSYKGEPTPLGSYQYYIDYEYTPQGIRKNHRGEVSVVR